MNRLGANFGSGRGALSSALNMPPTILLSRLLSFIAVVAGLAAGGWADTALSVEVGWNNFVHQGRWSPIFVSLSDPTPRNVRVSVETGGASARQMRIEQVVAAGPRAATFPIYLPLVQYNNDLTVNLADDRTGRHLATWKMDEELGRMGHWPQYMDEGKSFIGISGDERLARRLTGKLDSDRVTSVVIEPRLLPQAAVGLDALDVLILLSPDLEGLSADQQRAIVDWTRAGGQLILTPGDGGIPPASPLARILPGTVGSVGSIELTPGDLVALSLPGRFRNLAARPIEPRSDAVAQPIFPLHPVRAFRMRAGLGQVMIVPVELALLDFADTLIGKKFYNDLLAEFLPAPRPEGAARYGQNQWQPRQSNAFEAVGLPLADIPGVGQFGFSYIAIMLSGLLLVVGPIDYLVLKKIGRQPLTWVTVPAWVILITLGALYAGHVFKSGELHFRTAELRDQADNTVVAQSDFVAIYSPQTREYDLAAPAGSWWQPVSPYGYWRGVGGGVMLDFHQTQDDSRPINMEVPVWSLRLMQSETRAPAPPVLRAELKLDASSGDGPELVGTIHNLLDTPLNALAVHTGQLQSSADLTLGPKEVRAVRIPMIAATTCIDTPDGDDDLTTSYPTGVNGRKRTMMPGSGGPRPPWFIPGDLAPQRSRAIARALADGTCVVISARAMLSESDMKLENQAPVEKHWLYVRALSRLKP